MAVGAISCHCVVHSKTVESMGLLSMDAVNDVH